MKARPHLTIAFSCLMLILFSACSEEEIMSTPNEQLSSEEICFGVSKDASSWEPDSRALSTNESRALPCESEDPTFGVSVETKWRDTPNNSPQSRGAQFTTDSTLTQFDVTAFYYEENATTAETFFIETVTDGVNTSGKTYYWPREGSMDFIAIAPIGIANPMPTVDDYNTHSKAEFTYTIPDNISEQRDIMVAVSKGLTKETGNPVPLNFKHLLASVRFKVGEMQFIKINSLTLSNVYGGDVTFIYNKNTNTWTNSVPTTIKTYNPDFVDTSGLPQGSEIAGNVNNATLFMAPQKLPQGAKITVSYTELLTGESDTGEADISGNIWEAGKDYAYAFNIGTSFDVTIPTPADADAHYTRIDIPFDLTKFKEKLPDSVTVSNIIATAKWLEDGSNTSSKNSIFMKIDDGNAVNDNNKLTTMQRQGYFTDELWKWEYELDGDGNKKYIVGNANGPIRTNDNILGMSSLGLTSGSSGTIYLFIDENNGTTNRNGVLEVTATVENRFGKTDVVLGMGNFKQLCPSWNTNDIGVERIEDVNDYPWGFSYERIVTYTNSSASSYLSLPLWLQALSKFIMWLFGISSETVLPELDDEIANGFVTINKEKDKLGGEVVTSIVLDYKALNSMQYIDENGLQKFKAISDSGLQNTRELYSHTGDIDLAELENQLDGALNIKNDDTWSKDSPPESDTVGYYAAYIALTRNRMRELQIVVTNDGGKTTTKAILHKENEGGADNTGNESGADIIEWYLPSSAEAKNLKETGVGSNVITPLNGTYWSSTAGSDTDAHAHSFTFNNNTFGLINVIQPRMDELKVRAVRKKP